MQGSPYVKTSSALGFRERRLEFKTAVHVDDIVCCLTSLSLQFSVRVRVHSWKGGLVRSNDASFYLHFEIM